MEPVVVIGFTLKVSPLVPVCAPEVPALIEVTVPVPAEPLLAAVNLPCASTVIFAFVYEPAATPVLESAIEPVVVIGLTLNVKPLPAVFAPGVPALMDVTVPVPPEPLLAAVMRPYASTVRFVFVYEPAVTPEVARATVAGAPPLYANAAIPAPLLKLLCVCEDEAKSVLS